MSTLPETFRINTHQFNGKALELFHDQAVNIPVYASFLGHIGVDHSQVTQVNEIPFLPIRFFKTQDVHRAGAIPEMIFRSSGTGSEGQSRHFISDLSGYEEVCIQGFERQYDSLDNWEIFALLPSYLEREGSSLIYMVDHLIRNSGYKGGFYLSEYKNLLNDIRQSKAPKKLLIGVGFALLDFAESGSADLNNVRGLVVMETGGMKGRRREMTRSELHGILVSEFGVDGIHSEYGMTELLSQAYAKKDGLFECPPWMQIKIREIDDPFSFANKGRTGGINVIDLANKESCAFIATDDLGRGSQINDKFEVLGRFDHSDTRGCNLLILK